MWFVEFLHLTIALVISSMFDYLYWLSIAMIMLTNHSKTQWLKTISIYYCSRVCRWAGQFCWSGSGLAALGWVCSCICSQLLHQLGDGWSRMASPPCLMIHYLVTGVTEPPATAKCLSSTSLLSRRWEGFQKREEAQTRQFEAYVQNWHTVPFTPFYWWKQTAQPYLLKREAAKSYCKVCSYREEYLPQSIPHTVFRHCYHWH